MVEENKTPTAADKGKAKVDNLRKQDSKSGHASRNAKDGKFNGKGDDLPKQGQ